MKIDSPTFLTETTFISASVQFSSGSQKFGDTSDDLHQFTGSISVSGNVNGSTTSTGSFRRFSTTGTDGAIVIPNGTQGLIIGDQPYHGYLKYSSTGNNILAARSNGLHGATIIQNDGNKGRLGINTNDPVNSFYGTGDQDIVLMVEGNISSSGNFITTGNVSGSATSTGSFGRTVSGKFYASSNGAASNPEYSFTDDTDIGMYRHTTNGLGFATNGTARLNINGNGQVAINDTNPQDTLQIDHASGTGGNTLSVNANGVSGKGNIYAEGNISGSAASTGSFGMVMIKDSVGGPHKWFGDTYYLRTLSNLRIAGYIYSDGVINLDAGANDIRLGSSSGGANTIHFKTDGSTDGISIVQNHLSGSTSSTGSFGMITTPSDVVGKPAARLHRFAFLRASDHGDASTSAYNSKSGNTIFGYDAGSQIVQNNGAGHSNTYIGHYAGHGNASGDHNTFLGHLAGGVAGSGDDNVSIGSYSGYNLVTSAQNILIGQSSGFSQRSGSANVAIGDNALYASRGASQNTVMGAFAGYSVTTGTGVVG